MARPRLGYTFEGNLFPSQLRFARRQDLRRSLGVPAVSNHIGELVFLMAEADITVFPLWPGRERAHFIAMWLKRRFAEYFHDDPRGTDAAVEHAMACVEVTDRRPDDLDACVDYTAPGYDPAAAFSWAAIKSGMQRGWSLEGRT